MKMQEQLPSADASWIALVLYKLLPSSLGAGVMICVDPPADKRELFARIFVASACSLMLGDLVFDWLHTFSMFALLDPAKHTHTSAIDFAVGAVGWFAAGLAAMMLKKLRADPAAALRDAREAFKELKP